jgi:hypothetical protein
MADENFMSKLLNYNKSIKGIVVVFCNNYYIRLVRQPLKQIRYFNLLLIGIVITLRTI